MGDETEIRRNGSKFRPEHGIAGAVALALLSSGGGVYSTLGVSGKLDALSERLVRIEGKLERVEEDRARVDRLDERVRKAEEEITALKARGAR